MSKYDDVLVMMKRVNKGIGFEYPSTTLAYIADTTSKTNKISTTSLYYNVQSSEPEITYSRFPQQLACFRRLNRAFTFKNRRFVYINQGDYQNIKFPFGETQYKYSTLAFSKKC